jgi:hypothetical protein
VSAPAFIDPSLTFESDSGYQSRRVKHSRPRRRYTLDYDGKSAGDLRTIADFLQQVRFGAGQTFEWLHPTAVETNVPGSNTSPIWLTFPHALVTGQWVYMLTPTNLQGPHRITRVSAQAIALDGTVAQGDIQTSLGLYMPYAVARMADDTWESPTKIVGTDRVGPDRPGSALGAVAGYFSFSVVVEEVF